ncbi:MAG: hypothetical protein CL733_04695 [Chloroflexi bacterium]|nr:hypothetical protein [Chloroflexota bacterium]
MSGPLDGIKVIEFTQIIAGPFGGMLLSDMGAEVIKIEPLEGDPWRGHNEFLPNESRNFIGLNRGKRSLPLNIKDPEGLKIVHKLVETTDVVISNARPDVPKKLGIDYETLSKINPQIIYCDNTSFGRKGPDNWRPGYDLVIQAMSGLIAGENKLEDDIPKPSAIAVSDYTTGVVIAWGVSAALYARERTGQGQKIETSLLNTALALQANFIELEEYNKPQHEGFTETISALREANTDYSIMRDQHQELFGNNIRFKMYYTTYATSNGIIAVGCLNETLRRKASKIIEINDPIFESPPRHVSEDAYENMYTNAKNNIRSNTTNYWLDKFDNVGVPAGPVKFVQELLEDEQILENDMLVELEHTSAGKVKMISPLLKMSDTKLNPKLASPMLGEHTDEILGDLGYSKEKISELKNKNITK